MNYSEFKQLIRNLLVGTKFRRNCLPEAHLCVQVPLIYTVYALVSFRQFKTLAEGSNEAAKHDDWYELPEGYTLKTFDDIAASRRSRRSASWDEVEQPVGPASHGQDAEILAQMGL